MSASKTLVFAVALSLAIPLFGQSIQFHRDGSWWRSQEQPKKINYLNGFLDGIPLGHKMTVWKSMSEKNSAFWSKGTGDYDRYARKYLQLQSLELCKGLDEFYVEGRNLKIGIEDAVWVVTSKVSARPSERY